MPKRVLQGTVVSDKNEKNSSSEGRASLYTPAIQKDRSSFEELQSSRRNEQMQGRRYHSY